MQILFGSAPAAPGPLRVPCYDTSLYIDDTGEGDSRRAGPNRSTWPSFLFCFGLVIPKNRRRGLGPRLGPTLCNFVAEESEAEAAALIAREAMEGYARGHRAFKIKTVRVLPRD